jgi:hypothetical protein
LLRKAGEACKTDDRCAGARDKRNRLRSPCPPALPPPLPAPPLQGLTHARVTFTSEATGEYMFYELRLTATPPAPRGTLALECPVRTQTSARVAIANPLAADVELQATITGSRQVRLATKGQPGGWQRERAQGRHTALRPLTHCGACPLAAQA